MEDLVQLCLLAQAEIHSEGSRTGDQELDPTPWQAPPGLIAVI
ncbi:MULTISPECIES: hypothetical protein [Prochlorococcus]|nr:MULTISPECIES: hypothetical protein [Prochlorococcus]KZR67214.1 hypothetical protein PMIT1312_00504 [Prochlorococcus marinus str. MIT 1312]KZR83643.1 hypothetical protein PMIT1327_00414 [Prochlorococcus marinus str. MIT 1327]